MTQLPRSNAVSRRLPLVQPPYPPEAEKTIGSTAFKGLSPLNLRLALANHPKLANAFQSMAHVVLFQCAVSARDREIAIIRTGALTRSEYEWGMHVSIYGEKCDLSEAQILELTCKTSWRELSDHLWTPSEKLIVRMVDELHHSSTVSDETWSSLLGNWSQDQVIELIFSSSFYHMAAFFLNTAAVPLEDGSRRFPEGVAQADVAGA
jgi:alkylhydroperoxidase family enzyme